MIVNKYQGNGGGGGYVLPVASESTLGGVKVGSGLSIDSGGTLTSEGGVAQYDLDSMSQSERAAFVAMCENLTELEREELFVYRDKSMCRYDHTEGSGNSFKIGFSDYRQDGWSYPLTHFRHFFVKADGTYESLSNSSYPNVITFDTTYSNTAHTLSNSDGLSPLVPISNLGPGDAKMAINLRLIVQASNPTKTVLSSKAWSERTGSLEGKIGAEWHYSGNVITAVWNVVENNATIASWTEVPEGGSAGGGDYQIVEALSAITNPTDGMMAYVTGGEIYCDKLAVVGASELSSWAGGFYQFVQGEDYTLYRGNSEGIWTFNYKTGQPKVTYYWVELDPDLYVRYIGGEMQVAWKSETYPNATMQGNNFKGSDYKWGEVSGGIYVSLDHDAGLHIYENGRWNPTKKSYHIQDLISSTALTKEICDRTSDGEMDIRLFDRNGTFTCTQSTPNSWNSGETNFVEFRPVTASNKVQLYRKFIYWSNYTLNQDAVWESGLIGLYVGEFGFKYDIDNSKLYRQGSEVTASGIMPYGSFNPGHISQQLSGGELPYYKLEVVESGLTTAYAYPTISKGELASPVTIGDETFSNEFVLDYGKYIVKVYLNNDFGANFRLFKRTETQV